MGTAASMLPRCLPWIAPSPPWSRSQVPPATAQCASALMPPDPWIQLATCQGGAQRRAHQRASAANMRVAACSGAGGCLGGGGGGGWRAEADAGGPAAHQVSSTAPSSLKKLQWLPDCQLGRPAVGCASWRMRQPNDSSKPNCLDLTLDSRFSQESSAAASRWPCRR
jgi:hypothetical protein